MDELEFKRWAKRISERSGEAIEKSQAYVSLFTTDYKQSPQCALELGIAIMLDKPIGILALDETVIPENLKRVAIAIEYCKKDEPESQREASRRLMAKVKEVVGDVL